jgi:hypothetical protein
MIGLKLDKHIEVAIGRRVAAERGAKQGQPAYVMLATERRDFFFVYWDTSHHPDLKQELLRT